MTREQFLKLEFPNLPYCEFGLKRGPSNKFWESFHYRNASSQKQLNVFWSNDEKVSIGLYDKKESNPWKKNVTILKNTENFTQQDLNNYCNLHLK